MGKQNSAIETVRTYRLASLTTPLGRSLVAGDWVVVTATGQTLELTKSFGASATPASIIVDGGYKNYPSAITKSPNKQAINSTAAATAAQMLSGVITSTSAQAVSITTPTATAIAALIPGCGRGTSFDLMIDNSAGSNTITLVLDNSITVNTPVITGGATLTVSTVNTIGLFRFYFVSAVAAKVFRIF